MDRMLAVIVFVGVHAVGAVLVAACWVSISEWMFAGNSFSPAVRVPLVAAGVILAELLLLTAIWPCSRLARRLFGHACQPSNRA